jgi:hypothetical protein
MLSVLVEGCQAHQIKKVVVETELTQVILVQFYKIQRRVQQIPVAAAAARLLVLRLWVAAPALLSSSTPYLAKPSLYSKARLSGNVLRV